MYMVMVILPTGVGTSCVCSLASPGIRMVKRPDLEVSVFHSAWDEATAHRPSHRPITTSPAIALRIVAPLARRRDKVALDILAVIGGIANIPWSKRRRSSSLAYARRGSYPGTVSESGQTGSPEPRQGEQKDALRRHL